MILLLFNIFSFFSIGLKVEHDLNDFTEGRNVILTLKDQDVLAEDASDTLVNVNMMDDEIHKKVRRNYCLLSSSLF